MEEKVHCSHPFLSPPVFNLILMGLRDMGATGVHVGLCDYTSLSGGAA